MNIYKYYDEKKRRLAIRADKEEDIIKLTIIKCSTKDQFNKKLARQSLRLSVISNNVRLYGDLFHPEKITIPIIKDWRKDLFEYLDNTYYKIGYGTISYTTIELQRGDEHKIIKKIPYYKLR